MKNLHLTLLSALLILLVCSCQKEQAEPEMIKEIETEEPKVLTELEQQTLAAQEFAIAQTLLNEIMYLPFKLAFKNPDIFKLRGQKAEDRNGCPMVSLLPDMGSGDTLVMDFGNGCTMDNDGEDGPTVAGKIMLISFGDFNSNANQFVAFDTVNINGYEIIYVPGVAGSDLKFNNVTPFSIPQSYFFEGRLAGGSNFIITSPNGNKSTILPQFSPNPWTKVRILDNDPPLVLDYNDFIDARFEIEMELLTVSTFPPGQNPFVYFVTRIPGDPIVYEPACRWFQDGSLQFAGGVNQVIDFGVDLDIMGNTIVGTDCDGVIQICDNMNVCETFVCP